MCHGYKLASLTWCCQLLLCFDGEKSGYFMTHSLSFTVAATKKHAKQSHLRDVGIVGLSHVWTRQCTSTLSLQNGCVFGSRDAWFRASMLLSADTMNIFHQWTRLSLPLKQGSNCQHQLTQASLYSRHIMMSALRRDWQRIFNQLPYLVKIFWISISLVTTGKNFM